MPEVLWAMRRRKLRLKLLSILALLVIIADLQLLKVLLSPNGYDNHACDGQECANHHECENDFIILDDARVLCQTGQRGADKYPQS